MTDNLGTPTEDLGLPPLVPVWPKVVGIISIVWGSLGLVCNSCLLIGQAFQSASMGMMPQQTPDGKPMPPMPDVMKPGPLDLASLVLGLIVTTMLIVAGSLLVARKPQARGLHLGYAGVSLIATGAGTVVALMKQQAIANWARQNPDNFWGQQQTQMGGLTYAIIGLAVLLGAAYPIFTIIWFGLVKRDTRDITIGGSEELV